MEYRSGEVRLLDADDIRLLELRAKGKTLAECANVLGRTYDSVRWSWRKLKARRTDVLKAASEEEVEVVPVRPIRIEPEFEHGAILESGSLTSVHYGDTHFPFQSEPVLDILFQVLSDLQPDQIVHHGDLLDCYSISDYEKNPEHRIGLQREIEMGARHLGEVSKLLPQSRRILLKGNHEDRLRRRLWKASERGPLKEILWIPEVKSQLNWENLLGLDSSGWEWEDSKIILFDKMILKHGDTVRKHSAYTARSELDQYSKSGLSGHTHRLGSHYVRDWNGYHAWWETGCCCRLDPEYTEHPNWQNGFVVVNWSEDREVFEVEVVSVADGRAVFRGNVYSSG